MNHIESLIYGKIIIDDIQLATNEIIRGVIGGGGPQGAFGAALWSDSVGFLSRSGDDIEEEHVHAIEALDLDLTGWVRFAGIPTARSRMAYDENEYMMGPDGLGSNMLTRRENWLKLLNQRLPIPGHYQQPKLIHLITEFHDEPMVSDALKMRAEGAVLSLEPIIDYRSWKNRDGMVELIKQVDVVSPDWPAASGMAASDDPKEVMRYWSQLGPEMVTVRHGRHGSYAWDRGEDIIWHIPAIPVEVVDPTGAGNSYAGGACIGWLKSKNAQIAATHGAVSAWFLVSRVGLPEMSDALRQQAELQLSEYLPKASKL